MAGSRLHPSLDISVARGASTVGISSTFISLQSLPTD